MFQFSCNNMLILFYEVYLDILDFEFNEVKKSFFRIFIYYSRVRKKSDKNFEITM